MANERTTFLAVGTEEGEASSQAPIQRLDKITIVIFYIVGISYFSVPFALATFPQILDYLPTCQTYMDDPIQKRDFRAFMYTVMPVAGFYYVEWHHDVHFVRQCIAWRFFWVVPWLIYAGVAPKGLPLFLFVSFFSIDFGAPALNMFLSPMTSFKDTSATWFGAFLPPTSVTKPVQYACYAFGAGGFLLGLYGAVETVIGWSYVVPAPATPALTFGVSIVCCYWKAWMNTGHHYSDKMVIITILNGVQQQLAYTLWWVVGVPNHTVWIFRIYALVATVVVAIMHFTQANSQDKK